MTSKQFSSRLSDLKDGYAPYKVQESFVGLIVTCLVIMCTFIVYGTYLFPMAAVIGVGLGALAMIIFKITRAAYTVIKYLIKGD